MKNRLSGEVSPYLLQHKDNPVWWQPWCDEAIQSAVDQDKPIFLSVGYSTCHWCHVMEHESVENEEVAEILNRFFVCIKLDREERPDLDHIYMNALQALGQGGGWPMSMFLTPKLKPFFGGTYYPKPAFIQVLIQLVNAWKANRKAILESCDSLEHLLKQILIPPKQKRVALKTTVLHKVFEQSMDQFDRNHGGFGNAPKFPAPLQLRLLMRIYHRSHQAKILDILETTLDKMARGGIYDHLGGGFARYSVDDEWLVPHFEKMLYSQALLAGTYLEAFQLTNNNDYKEIARETLDYVINHMTHPEGGYYSAEDADSEGEEGKYYVWQHDELTSLLSQEEQELVFKAYGVTKEGNFERQNILNLQEPYDWSIKKNPVFQSATQKLLSHRANRIPPFKDDKILTAWNALMIETMTKARQVLGPEEGAPYLRSAMAAAHFISTKLTDKENVYCRFRDNQAGIPGTLADYSYLVSALLSLYETNFNEHWMRRALYIHQLQNEKFWDDEDSGYFNTAEGEKNLIIRSKDYEDEALPNANGVAAMNLIRLFLFTGDQEFHSMFENMLRKASPLIWKYPTAFNQLLMAFDFYDDRFKEIVIAGKKDSQATVDFIDLLHLLYLPNKVMAFKDPEAKAFIKILEQKPLINEQTTAYVCEGFSCKQPTTDIREIETLAQSKKRYSIPYTERR